MLEFSFVPSLFRVHGNFRVGDSREIRGRRFYAGMYAGYHLVRPYALFLFPIQMLFFSFLSKCLCQQTMLRGLNKYKGGCCEQPAYQLFLSLFQAERQKDRTSEGASGREKERTWGEQTMRRK